MVNIFKKSECCGCHACFNICPQNAIEMIEDEKGFKYPKVDNEKCINCGLCQKVCPIVNNKKTENEAKVYACINLNDETRKESSSGGVFSLIAEAIIEQGGVVFGASFDDNFKLRHTFAEKKNELKQFRGSKYLQSTIGDSYKKAKEYLDQGRKVLFTGTPCQIEGLKKYLIKEYDNLLTQDIICHGVPSPKVWRKYKKFRETQEDSKIIDMSFRDKEYGWGSYHVRMNFENNNKYSTNHNKDIYMKAFLNDICLRDSCYECQFKKINRESDITLADFWGIKNVLPEMNDDKGTSLVFINSNKGREILETIKDKIKFEEVDLKKAVQYNASMNHVSKKNIKTENFFEDLEKFEFDKLVKKYIKEPNFIKKMVKKAKKIVKKIYK